METLENFLFFFLSTVPIPDGLIGPTAGADINVTIDFALGTLENFLFSFSLYKRWTEGFGKPADKPKPKADRSRKKY